MMELSNHIFFFIQKERGCFEGDQTFFGKFREKPIENSVERMRMESDVHYSPFAFFFFLSLSLIVFALFPVFKRIRGCRVDIEKGQIISFPFHFNVPNSTVLLLELLGFCVSMD